jgi:hypothetical protein
MTSNEASAYRHFRARGMGAWLALALARNEAAAREHGIHFVWADDPEGWSAWRCDERMGRNQGERKPGRVEFCYAVDPDDEPLPAALFGIIDADVDHRREVEAQLAGEAVEAYLAALAPSLAL